MIFVKEPRPGRVKTRLGREAAGGIGSVAAARWFRGQALRLIARLARDPRWQVRLAVSPDRAGLESRVWPRAATRQRQGAGDIGARMARALAAAPPGPVLVIGADIPGISPARIAEAFRALGRADAVFGPALDGGFWLAGFARRPLPAGLFGGVRWSTEHALADALATLGSARITFAATLADVDTAEDLARLRR